MTRFIRPDGAIPLDRLPQQTPLWCVYGNPNFPHMMCCKLKPSGTGPVLIWSWATWETRPGWYGIGDEFSVWHSRNRMAYFFADHNQALDFMRALTTPEDL